MFIYTDKKNGTVLEITAYRVPGVKNPKQKKVCIGKMNEDGVFVPNKFYLERTKKEELQTELEKLQKELDEMKKGSYE